MRTSRHSWAVTISAILLSLTVKSVCSAELMGLDNVTFGNFNFQFVDRVNDTGIGFDDPMIATNGMTVGDNRVALLGEVAAHLSDVLNVTGTANVEIRASLDDETSTALASGGSAFFRLRIPAGFGPAGAAGHQQQCWPRICTMQFWNQL